MSIFNLAISCLTASNLPWFEDLKSRSLCSIVLYSVRLHLHHKTHPPLGVVSSWPSSFVLTGAVSNCPPLSRWRCWTPHPSCGFPSWGRSSSIFIYVFPFILSVGFLWQEYWGGLPFPPGDHILSKLFIMTHPPWVALMDGSWLHWVTQAPLPQLGGDPWRRHRYGMCLFSILK